MKRVRDHYENDKVEDVEITESEDNDHGKQLETIVSNNFHEVGEQEGEKLQ